MSYEKLPSDDELFPHLGSGCSLHNDYIDAVEKLRSTAVIPKGQIKDRDEYSIFLGKLTEQNRRLNSTMEHWLVERILDGGVVDSFPPEEYELLSFSVEKTTTTTTYDPYYDCEEESVSKDKDDLSIGVRHFPLLLQTMLLFEREMKDEEELSNGTKAYWLMKPLYRAVHTRTVGWAVKKLFSPAVFTAVCLLLAWGLSALSAATVNSPLIGIPITLVGWGAILAAVCGGIWLIARIFGFFKNLGKLLSTPKLLKQAAKNAPTAYRLLRYYRLWENETGKSQRGVSLMDKYLGEYLEKYPLR